MRAALALPGTITPTSLRLQAGLSFPEWERAVHVLLTLRGAIQWLLGDALLYGEKHFGEQFAQAVAAYDAHTLANLQWVASRIEPSRRRESLSWSHHEAVAALEPKDQEQRLTQAEQAGWTRSELRKALKGEPVEIQSCPPHVCRRCGKEIGL